MMPNRKRPPPPTSPAQDDAESAFDQWLGRQLAHAYDEVLKEEVPEDLKRLVQAFRDKEAGGEEAGEGQPDDASGEQENADVETPDASTGPDERGHS